MKGIIYSIVIHSRARFGVLNAESVDSLVDRAADDLLDKTSFEKAFFFFFFSSPREAKKNCQGKLLREVIS